MKRVILAASVGSMSLVGLLNEAARAQPPARPELLPVQSEARAPKASNYLQGGVEAHLRGEFETAEKLLRRAESARAELLEPERIRLEDYLKKNSLALTARRQALEQLQLAEDAFKAGRPQDAEPALRVLRANKYLTAKEIQQVNTLSEQVQRKPGQGWGLLKANPAAPVLLPPPSQSGAAPSAVASTTENPEALLSEARMALNRRRYDQAEELAARAEQAGYRTVLPWKESPEKIRRDVEQARSLAGRELLKQARAAIGLGELAKAKQLVAEAESLKPNLMWWDEYSPDKVRAELTRAESSSSAVQLASSQRPEPMTRPGEKVVQAVVKPANPVQLPDDLPTDSVGLTKQARQYLNKGQLELAEAAAQRARQLPGIQWTILNDTPDKVLADVAKARGSTDHERAAALLAEARQRLELGQFEAAEKLTYQAERLRSSYPIWHRGDRHDVLRAEIEKRRKEANRPNLPPLVEPASKTAAASNGLKPTMRESDQKPDKAPLLAAKFAVPKPPADLVLPEKLPVHSATATPTARPVERSAEKSVQSEPPRVIASSSRPEQQSTPAAVLPVSSKDEAREKGQKLLATARAHLVRGEHDEALQIVNQVQAMGLTFRDGEDTPAKVRAALRDQAVVQSVAPSPQNAESKRQQALKHLAEARRLQKEGLLLQALAEVESARACGAIFAPGDDLPEAVLAELKKDCTGQIDASLAVADTLASHGRYQDAEAYLNYSRQLALGFKLPAFKIDEHLIQVKGLAARGPETAEPDPQAKALIQAIEQEVKQGHLAEARRLAESLYNGPFGMKPQAAEWLARLDALEFRKDSYEAEVYYELAVQAFISKDFDGAASYLNGADLRLLDRRKQAHARELLASIEQSKRSK